MHNPEFTGKKKRKRKKEKIKRKRKRDRERETERQRDRETERERERKRERERESIILRIIYISYYSNVYDKFCFVAKSQISGHKVEV